MAVTLRGAQGVAILGNQDDGLGIRSARTDSGRRPQHLEAAGKLSLQAITLIWVSCAAVVGVLSYWAYDTKLPMEFITSSVVPDGGAPGDRVVSRYRVSILRNCTLDVERSWVDSNKNIWPSTTAHLSYSPGTYDINLTSAIPMDAWSGKALLSNVVAYSCNPLQYIFPRRQSLPELYVTVQR